MKEAYKFYLLGLIKNKYFLILRPICFDEKIIKKNNKILLGKVTFYAYYIFEDKNVALTDKNRAITREAVSLTQSKRKKSAYIR